MTSNVWIDTDIFAVCGTFKNSSIANWRMRKNLITYQYYAFKFNGFYFFLVRRLLPTHCNCRGLLLRLVTLSDTHTHIHILDRTPLDETSPRRRDLVTSTTHNIQKRETSTGFKLTIAASQCPPRTHVLDRAVTGIGTRCFIRVLSRKRKLYLAFQ
jgi:hypothetical protein